MTLTSPARPEPGPHRHSPAVINLGGLEQGLRQAVEGEVRFDAATKAMYANDGSNFRQVPIGWSSRGRWRTWSRPTGSAPRSAPRS